INFFYFFFFIVFNFLIFFFLKYLILIYLYENIYLDWLNIFFIKNELENLGSIFFNYYYFYVFFFIFFFFFILFNFLIFFFIKYLILIYLYENIYLDWLNIFFIKNELENLGSILFNSYYLYVFLLIFILFIAIVGVIILSINKYSLVIRGNFLNLNLKKLLLLK